MQGLPIRRAVSDVCVASLNIFLCLREIPSLSRLSVMTIKHLLMCCSAHAQPIGCPVRPTIAFQMSATKVHLFFTGASPLNIVYSSDDTQTGT